MPSPASDSVHAYFRANARNVAPASLAVPVSVLFAPASTSTEVTSLCAALLSEEERQAASKLLTDELRARFVQRRAFRRFCAASAGAEQPLDAIEFAFTEIGAPFLPALPHTAFSFSACSSGYLAAWSTACTPGVDIEDRKKVEAADLARTYFTPREADAVAAADDASRLKTFLQFWTLKEAALKSIGEGLPFGLDTFEFELGPPPRIVNAPSRPGIAERFTAQFLDVGSNYHAALVTRSNT